MPYSLCKLVFVAVSWEKVRVYFNRLCLLSSSAKCSFVLRMVVLLHVTSKRKPDGFSDDLRANVPIHLLASVLRFHFTKTLQQYSKSRL